MKFIEGVLYGFYKPAQRRQYTADYEKYRPWDGGSYGGTLVYETEGQYVAVYRDFEKDEVRMWDVTTKEDLTKELPYNEFYRQWEPAARDFKISAAAFRNTISIVQGKASADLSQVGGELQESLLNLTSSGDEEISVRHSLSSLRQQWEQIGSESQEKNSLLGELSIREEALKARLRESGEARVRQERIYQELSQLPEDVEDAEGFFQELSRECGLAERGSENRDFNGGKAGIRKLEPPACLPYWNKGIRYVTVEGPEGLKLEFCEKLK